MYRIKDTRILVIMMLSGTILNAQKLIDLPYTTIENIAWELPPREYYSEIWQNEVLTNIAAPRLQVFLPTIDSTQKAAVIIAPGGGMYALSIETEGRMVAQWLNERGIAAFVLQYRLVPTGEDAVAEISNPETPTTVLQKATQLLPYAIEDGLNAVEHVRINAEEYGINPNKIGFIGFSAGGAVTMGVGYQYTQSSKPNFLIPVYAWTDAQPIQSPKPDCPPMLIICSTDDPLGLAKGSIDLYNSMLEANKNVGLRMFAKGGHGYGMKIQNLLSDNWIAHFYEWGVSEGFFELLK